MVDFPGPARAEFERGPHVRRAGAASSVPCGFFRYSVRESRFAAYSHCGTTTVRLHVDVSSSVRRRPHRPPMVAR
ncbi:DUF6355 family natural product biosynthesis protein [Streptomyces laculatispora]|uniref:DUF6355 family natural product biosynthesis protein n=1 Tax=Streptomyces laculatispora TaxID=887464 RepID=UPI00351514C8